MPAPSLRGSLESRFAQLVPELEELAQRAALETAASACNRLAEHLNQAVRRLRETRDFAAIAGVLAESAAPFARSVAVFRVQDGTVIGERAAGVPEEAAAKIGAVEFPLSSAAAFAQALETADPVVAASTAGEVSAAVVDAFGHSPGERISVVPIIAGGRTAGFLYGWGEAQAAPLEMLAQAAGMSMAARSVAQPPAGLVAIAAAAGAGPGAAGQAANLPAPDSPRAVPDWAALAAPERDAHRSAQRFARVQAAEMRLYRRDAVAQGRASGDLYGALRDAIDAARELYRQRFLTTPGMPDYLHAELLHTLANDDTALLGPNYPGPLA